VELDKVLSVMLRAKVADLARGASYDAQIDRLLAGTTDPYHAAQALLADS
jgi:hypothetical protein